MEEKELDKSRESMQVRKSNVLIQKSDYKLSLHDLRFFLYMIAKVKYGASDFAVEEIPIARYFEICGIEPGGRTYELMRERLKHLSSPIGWKFDPDTGEESLAMLLDPHETRISKDRKTIIAKLDVSLKKYILNLNGNFTQYFWFYTLCFSSEYSIRLYELVSSLQYDATHPYKKTYTLEEFKTRIGANGLYPDFRNLRRRVIEPAVNDVNDYSEKNVSIEYEKTGRAYTGIVITISQKTNDEYLKMRERIDDKMGNKESVFKLLNEAAGI